MYSLPVSENSKIRHPRPLLLLSVAVLFKFGALFGDLGYFSLWGCVPFALGIEGFVFIGMNGRLLTRFPDLCLVESSFGDISTPHVFVCFPLLIS